MRGRRSCDMQGSTVARDKAQVGAGQLRQSSSVSSLLTGSIQECVHVWCKLCSLRVHRVWCPAAQRHPDTAFALVSKAFPYACLLHLFKGD